MVVCVLWIFVESRGFIADSEGAGRFCGSRSGFVVYGPRGGTMDIIYNSDGNINGPKGVRGGGMGACAHQHKINTNGDRVEVPNCGRVTLQDGEMIASYSCGGGGYGQPFDRDPELVKSDLLEGYISEERALKVYGLNINNSGKL